MNFSNMTIEEYANELKAKKSVPGGGSVLALTLELACSLCLMCANFTIGKKGYEEHCVEVEEISKELETYSKRAHELIDLDGIAFNALMEAYRSKEQNRIEEASKDASEVPYELYLLTKKVEDIAKRLLVIGNKNVTSDASIAKDLCEAIYPGCILNIKANVASVKDEEAVERYKKII